MSEYESVKEALRAEFNVRFDMQSTVLHRSMGRDEYSTYRALCFEWYLNGFFDGVTGGDGEGLAEGLRDASEGSMTKQTKTQCEWGIVNGEGELLPFTIRHSRSSAIYDFCANHGYDIPEGTRDVWRWLQRCGNRCEPVVITFNA
jgi:hypothetical protein